MYTPQGEPSLIRTKYTRLVLTTIHRASSVDTSLEVVRVVVAPAGLLRGRGRGGLGGIRRWLLCRRLVYGTGHGEVLEVDGVLVYTAGWRLALALPIGTEVCISVVANAQQYCFTYDFP